MEDVELKQGNFEGWAIVEMMGHRKEIGYVTTQAFGQAVLFRVDVPELPEREFTLTSPAYARPSDSEMRWCPEGTKVRRPASPARSCLVAPGSLYAINPCSEDAARTAIEKAYERPLIVLELPLEAKRAIAAAEEILDGDDSLQDEEDRF